MKIRLIFGFFLLALGSMLTAAYAAAQTPITVPPSPLDNDGTSQDAPASPVPTPTLNPPPSLEAQRDDIEAAYHFALAKLLTEEASFEKAEKAYTKSLDLDADDPYSQLEYARFSSYMGQIASGNPKNQLEYLEKAVKAAEAARALAPENLDVLRTFAQIHMQLGRYRPESLEMAQQAYETLNEETEGDLQVLTSLGQLYLWKRDPAKASEVLEEAARFMPSHRTISAMLVESLLASEQVEKAETAIERLLTIDPTALEYRLQLATLLSQRGEHRAAVAVIDAAPESLQDNKQLLRQLARELYLSGDHERALATIDPLLDSGPGSSALRRLRVAVLDSLSRFDEALGDFLPQLHSEAASGRQLQDIVLAGRLYERLGRGDEAADWIRSHLESRPSEEVRQLRLILAGTLERNGAVDEAAALVEELLRGPSGQEAFLSQALSEIYQRAGRTDDAVDVLTRSAGALADTGESEAADRIRLLQLMTLSESERWNEVIAASDSVLASPHEELREGGRLVVARALAKAGRFDEAYDLLDSDGVPESQRRRTLVEKIQLNFENDREAEARALLAGILDEDGVDGQFLGARILQRAGHFDEAVPLLETILAERADSVQALFMLGVSQERSGAHEAAITTFEQLIDVEPDHSDALNYLGYMLAERGQNLDQALQLILRANSLDTDNGAFVDSLGWVYYQLGQTEEARQHLEWAARLVPEDPTIYDHLGDVYIRLDETELAIQAYRQALDLGADDPAAIEEKLQQIEKGPES